jgi:hypothetical protein
MTRNGKHWRLFRNGESFGQSRDGEALYRSVGKHLHLCVGEFADPQVFLHAAVVVFNGRAIVLPGRSLAGKSTLALALARLPGAILYSDDFAVLQGPEVVPYALPLSLRQPDGPPRLIEARELGWSENAGPMPVALVLLANYQRLGTWKPNRLSPGQAVVQLAQHTLGGRLAPERIVATLSALADKVPVYQSQRGETEEVLSWLQEAKNFS